MSDSSGQTHPCTAGLPSGCLPCHRQKPHE
jgi:hypothetical protein